jgi:ATP-dependent helicase/nuclease subunit A
MSNSKFTPEQQKAIDKNKKSLLVSAAAGSGKTTVLVERVRQILVDSENPVSPDKLLVVTFTNAAATEMKERIASKLQEQVDKAKDDDEKRYAKKQQMLLSQCNISTIDSFCQQLVRDNFQLTDIDCDFKYLSSADRAELSNIALNQTIEYVYKTYEDEGAKLIRAMKDTVGFSEEIKRLYDHAYSLPFPDDFFSLAKKNYEIDEKGNNYYADRVDDDLKEAVRNDVEKLSDQINIFIDATKYYMDYLLKLKEEKNMYDFSDIEHVALNLLCKREDGKDIVTKEGKDLANKFKYVLVDEYQDTNELQDKIFRILSNNGENLFIVGDSKQSIYRFRQANPEIFINLKKEDDGQKQVNLSANFRSNEKICNLVNSVFAIFDDTITGGIDYTKEELIPRANYAKDGDYTPELWLTDIESTKDKTATVEAKLISKWIKERIESGYEIFDLKENKKRKMEYKDVAILLRSANKSGAEYKNILNKNGIPAYFYGEDNPYTELEIKILLDLLKAVNNPFNDISLYSALLSPFFGFTPDDLVKIKKQNKGLYTSLIMSAQEGFSKAVDAVKTLEDLKEKSATMPINLFIEDLYLSMGYYAIVGGMPDGEIKQRNLLKIVSASENYTANSNGTLRGFIKYVENLQEKDDSAGQISNEDNIVKIMSGHKSKGLEYPICFIAGMGTKFNADKDHSSINSKSGIGINYYDEASNTIYQNKVRELIKEDNKKEYFAEELRVLYVELTRAKNKLICTLTGNHQANFAKKMAEIDQKLDLYKSKDKNIDFATMKDLGSMGNLLYFAVKLSDADIKITDRVPVGEEDEVKFSSEKADEQMVENLKKRFSTTEEKLNIPAKITASELNRQSHGTEYNFESTLAFLADKGLTPAQKGTAMHNFMQYCNFDNANDDFDKEADRLAEAGFISPEARNSLNKEKIKAFFESNLYDRINSAKEIYREKQFTVLIKSSEIFEDTYSDKNTVVQGICDLAFIENGKITIIDYKTDSCNNAYELFLKYKEQLKLYAKCLSKVLGIETGKIGIYSFSKGEVYEEEV